MTHPFESRARAALVAVAMALALAPAAAQETLERSLAAAADGEVRISNVAGSVRVSGWDRAEVSLVARLADAEQRLEIEERRGVISIRVRDQERGVRRAGGAAELELRIPAGSRLQVNGVSADIQVRGVSGAQELQTVSGRLEVEGYGRDIRARSVSGDVRLAAPAGAGRSEVASVSGDVRLLGPEGELDASVVSGRLEIRDARLARLRLNSVSGDVEATVELADGGRLDAESVSGDLRVRLQRDIEARFELQTFSGQIDDCDGHRAEPQSRFGPGRRLVFARGDESAEVRARSMSGRLSVCDR